MKNIKTFESFSSDLVNEKKLSKKDLAAKYPPADEITRGDIIQAAIDNKEKDEKEFLTPKQRKLPEHLKKAIIAKLKNEK